MRLGLLVFVAILIASACSAAPYREPASGERARVRFINKSIGVTDVRTFGDKNCSTAETRLAKIHNGDLPMQEPRRIGMPLWDFHEHAAKEFYVYANTPIFGLMDITEVVGSTQYRCGVPFTYSFSSGSDYEVEFKWTLGRQCRVDISTLIKESDGIKRSLVAQFSSHALRASEGCMAAFNALRLNF